MSDEEELEPYLKQMQHWTTLDPVQQYKEAQASFNEVFEANREADTRRYISAHEGVGRKPLSRA